MLSIRNVLCAVLVTGVLLSAPSAEARFGKRSDSSEKNDSKEHDATAVGEDSDDDEHESSGGGHGGGGSYAAPRSTGSVWWDLLFAIFFSPSTSRHTSPSGTVDSSSDTSALTLRLGVDGAAMGNGAGVGAFLGFEGEQWGLEGRVLGLVLPTDDGTPGTDSITLTNVHLTLALVSMEKARLRVEGGFSSAHAPDISFIGPSMALSFEACLAGPLDIEMRLQATPFPYRQVEGNAGMAVHLNTLMLRGGWRGVFLDDQGRVDGVVHEDAFSGPYLGLGFAF